MGNKQSYVIEHTDNISVDEKDQIVSIQKKLPIPDVEVSDNKKLTKKEINEEIKKWFDIACEPFSRFTEEHIIGNDSPFDIDSLEKAASKWYKELTGYELGYITFQEEVSKRCKKQNNKMRSSYTIEEEYEEEE